MPHAGHQSRSSNEPVSSNAPRAGHSQASPQEALAALSRVLQSSAFHQAEKPAEFLRYVVTRAASGDASGLKETSIGVELYQKDPGYDPKIDSLVRTQARRVRTRLAEYYAGEGAADPVEIRIPKGSYVPIFLDRETPPAPARTGHPRWVFISTAILVFAAVAALVLWRYRPTAAQPFPQPSKDIARVLVLPFRPSGSASEDHLYGHALADSIIASIAGIQGLAVLTAQEPAGGPGSLAESDPSRASAMKADYLVTGGFTRAGDASTITAKLTRVADGSVLWSRSYRFPWSALISTEQEMSSAVSSILSERLNGRETDAAAQRQPSSKEAYQEYMAGYYGAVQARQSANLIVYDSAKRHLDRAIQLEPTYSEAHATLANLILSRVVPWTPQNQVLVDQAEQHAKAALKFSPQHPGAHAALARCSLLRRDLMGAHEKSAKALAISPSSVEALCSAGDTYTALGLHESALRMFLAAADRPFVSMEPFLFGAFSALRQGKLKDAESLVARHREVDPESMLNLQVHAILLSRQGNFAESEMRHRRVLEIVDSRSDIPESVRRQSYGFARVTYALSLVRAGKLDAAKKLAAKLGPPIPRRIEDEILLLVALGRKADALKTIDESFFFRNYRFLVTEPGLRPLYSEPGFKRLLEQTYPQWQATLRDLGPTLPAKPPSLPPPGEFLHANRS